MNRQCVRRLLYRRRMAWRAFLFKTPNVERLAEDYTVLGFQIQHRTSAPKAALMGNISSVAWSAFTGEAVGSFMEGQRFGGS